MKTKIAFLKSVLYCSLLAYGGPFSHYGIFLEHLVKKKKYLSEEELSELIALCTILPGPSSSQSIVAIGYKTGGQVLAFLTMLVWALPVIFIMTTLAVFYQYLSPDILNKDVLRFLIPISVSFIVNAAISINKKTLKDSLTVFIFVFSAIISFFFKENYVILLLIFLGGALALVKSGQKNTFNKIKLKPKWAYLIVFTLLATATFLQSFIDNVFFDIFSRFYRYGFLVFGGGQVLIPVIFSDMVENLKVVSQREFLIAYGVVQAMPGPMFSFSSFIGAMFLKGKITLQILAGITASVGIFLPGILLIYFVYPLWEEIKKIKAIKISLKGINAVAGALIFQVALSFLIKGSSNILSTIVSFIGLILLRLKIPAPFIVIGSILAGFLFWFYLAFLISS